MLQYDRLLLNNIEREKNGMDYYCTEADKLLLSELLREINMHTGTDFHYLAELDAFIIPDAGKIIAKYIANFSSESVKGYLIPNLIADKVKECDKLILQLYLHFKSSNEYIASPGKPAPAHIYVRYDNAFRKLKPKRLASELVELAHYPRDAFYLPFTMRMIASWGIAQMRDLLISYTCNDWITAQSVGLPNSEDPCYPSLEFMRRELKFTAIEGLKYYPSGEVRGVIAALATGTDEDICAAAKGTLRIITR